ncbi:leucine-rich repeat-containing protein 47-like protein, partial [Leptotrombidium deliense]
MSVKWVELVQQKPRELVLSGKEVTKQIEDENGLNEVLFRISTLNFLEVSKTNLTEIPSKIDQLSNLTNLVLSGNKLSMLPTVIGNLKKLKLLDVSYNNLEALPDEIGNLVDLQSLLLTMNNLSSLPSSLSKLSNLHVIKFGHNKLQKFPDALCDENLKLHLSEIHAPNNQIEDIPSNIDNLAALKLLDLSENKVKDVPGELSDCSKMKDLNLKGNKLSDRRLLKLVEQGKQKQILDYIKAHCAKSRSENSEGTNGEKKSRGKDSVTETEVVDVITIVPIKMEDRKSVVATAPILEMRKIVACIVRNVNFE